jgi:hypothetical protein
MMRRFTQLAAAVLFSGALAGWGQTIAQNTEFRVRLLGPLNTDTAKKNDQITAQALTPEEFKGDILEGRVTESKSGGKITGTSSLNFTFSKLHHGGRAIPVKTEIKQLINSQGKPDVDEEGRIVRRKNSVGKVAAGTAVGAAIGAILGGAKGAAVGAGAGAAGSLILIQTTAKGANISFATGSEFVLLISEQPAEAARER